MTSLPRSPSESYFANLVGSLKKGDHEAVEEIWKSFGPDLRRRARTRLRQYGMMGHTDSMDICNSVLMELVRQQNFEINDPKDLIKYIRAAIDNQVRDEYKMLTRARRDIRRNENAPVEEHRILNENTSPSQIMVRNEIFERLVRQLGPDGEIILRLVKEEHSWDSIAKQVRSTADAVRMRWKRATKIVQAQIFSESECGT